MRLDRESRDLLGRARIGMLALNTGREPLVNPAAFHFSGGSLWMTTSRFAAKLSLARRDPRAAFLVDLRGEGVHLEGLLEPYDLRTVSGQVRAALEGPRLYMGMAGYAVKNAGFVAGYLLDLVDIPREWWPQNRVVLRLRPDRAHSISTRPAGARSTVTIPGLPADLARSLGRISTAYLCWSAAGTPHLAPALWSLDEGAALAWLPAGSRRLPPVGVPAALVVEPHHPYRATRMLGACLRGELQPAEGAAEALAGRYGGKVGLAGGIVRIELRRVTWWRGFEVRTTAAVAAKPAVAARPNGTGGGRQGQGRPARSRTL